MTNMLSVAEAKARLSEILTRVHQKGERYIIRNRGTPVAAVVPLADLSADQWLAPDDWLHALLDLGSEGDEYADLLDEIVKERSSHPPREVELGDD